MVDAIIKRGTPEQRDWAIRTQRITAQFRDERHAAMAVARIARGGERKTARRLYRRL
jgi:hypothetical protein